MSVDLFFRNDSGWSLAREKDVNVQQQCGSAFCIANCNVRFIVPQRPGGAMVEEVMHVERWMCVHAQIPEARDLLIAQLSGFKVIWEQNNHTSEIVNSTKRS